MMKRAIRASAGIALGALLAFAVISVSSNRSTERRRTIYAIQLELRAGLTRSEVQEVISRHDAPFLHRTTTPDGMVLRVDTGFANSCLLSIRFRGDRLYEARIRGEDGPHEVFPDAPPDILTTSNQSMKPTAGSFAIYT